MYPDEASRMLASSTPQRRAIADGSEAGSLPVVMAGTDAWRRDVRPRAASPATTRLAEALESAPPAG